MDNLVKQSINLFKKQKYRITIHAEREREHDGLSLKDIEECFFSGKMELIEDYAEDPRGHSFLLLGFTQQSQAVHLVCAIHEKELIIVTLYKPDPLKWENWKKRLN